MMKEILNVPTYVRYLSDWNDFNDCIPNGKVIINKGICGCGFTEYCLNHPTMNTILASPRNEMLSCKQGKSNRPYKTFYFDRTQNCTVHDSVEMLRKYIMENMYDTNPCKILVTYDSLNCVMTNLSAWGVSDQFTIVMDEFSCLFSDSSFKGRIDLEVIRNVMKRPNNIWFISATPTEDRYLEQMPEFAPLRYVEMKWPEERYEKVRVFRQEMKSTVTAASNIINLYKSRGYFKKTVVNNQEVYSKEAVFFINDVKQIASIIKKCNLKPEEVLVVCSNDGKNKECLRNVKIKIGHVPGENEYKKANKPYTFVSRKCFEGTDFYSDCSSCYVFADMNVDSQALDISIDLKQIAGRCRTMSNPFRFELNYYYKTGDPENLEKFMESIKDRDDKSARILSNYGATSDPDLLEIFEDAQKQRMYTKNYIDVISDDSNDPDNRKLEYNLLAKLAQIRAYDIKKEQYTTVYSILVFLDSAGFETVTAYDNPYKNEIDAFYQEFFMDGDFSRRMKLYTDIMVYNPSIKPYIEVIDSIPYEFKEYFNNLSPKQLHELGFKQSKIEKENEILKSKKEIENVLKKLTVSGNRYSRSDLKEILQQAYKEVGLQLKPTGNDILKYYPNAQYVTYTENNKRNTGFII